MQRDPVRRDAAWKAYNYNNYSNITIKNKYLQLTPNS